MKVHLPVGDAGVHELGAVGLVPPGQVKRDGLDLGSEECLGVSQGAGPGFQGGHPGVADTKAPVRLEDRHPFGLGLALGGDAEAGATAAPSNKATKCSQLWSGRRIRTGWAVGVVAMANPALPKRADLLS